MPLKALVLVEPIGPLGGEESDVVGIGLGQEYILSGVRLKTGAGVLFLYETIIEV